MNDENQFSEVKFFHEFRIKLKEINTYPLSEENLIIHQDLIKMLGDEDVEFYYPFASLAMDRPRTFGDLLFSIDFFNGSFTLSIDQQSPVEIEYTTLHLSEKALAEELVRLATALANGQIAVLATLADSDQLQAVEVLYRQKDANLYNILRTYPSFSTSRRLKTMEYSTELKKNDNEIKPVIVNPLLLEQVLPQSTIKSNANRPPIQDLNLPLTKKDFDRYSKQASDIEVEAWMGSLFPKKTKNHKESKLDKAIRLTKYRHIEAISAILIAFITLTLGDRQTGANILLYIASILLGIALAIAIYKRTWLLKIITPVAYALTVLFCYTVYFADNKTFLQWVVLIVAFEPIIEMLIFDPLSLSRRGKSKHRKK